MERCKPPRPDDQVGGGVMPRVQFAVDWIHPSREAVYIDRRGCDAPGVPPIRSEPSMRPILLILFALLAAMPQRAESQQNGRSSFVSGIKLRGNVHFNRAVLDSPDFDARNAYGVGAEYVGRQLGVGLYGYTDGSSPSALTDTTTVYVVAEVNYYLPIEELRLAPYLGIHSHLGNFDRSWFDDPSLPRPQDGIDSLGYQIGIRYKPLPILSVDAQWRQQSQSVWDHQQGFLERNQILLGVVLF
jgi:hypothetical protein